MKVLEFKTQYQDLAPYFGQRNGKLYSGNFAVDGSPVPHYGPIFKGVGKPENGIGISSLMDVSFAQLPKMLFVEGTVQQRNPRTFNASSSRWSFFAAKGFQDPNAVRCRSSNMLMGPDGNVPVAPVGAAEVSAAVAAGQPCYAQIRYDQNLMIQHYETNSANITHGSASISIHYTPAARSVHYVADMIPLEGISRFACLCYCGDTSIANIVAPKTMRIFDKVGTTYTTVGDVQVNNTGDTNTANVGYAIPLDESLIERDGNGAAIAYHFFYTKPESATPTVPGKLIYKKLILRPTFSVPAEETIIEDITTGTWGIKANTQGGDIALRTEGRAFVYEHLGVRYLTVMYKNGRNGHTAGYSLPYTVKRAVLTNGVAGAFETFTFTPPFSAWGPALVLSEDRKTLWHYTHEGCSVAALRFTDTVTMDSALNFAGDPYIASIAVENDKMMALTSNFRKYVFRIGAAAPTVNLAFDKSTYTLGEAAVLTVTTPSASPITVTIEVIGATVTEHVVEVSASTPETIDLIVSGQLQAAMVDW